jgi:hypothetical protein
MKIEQHNGKTWIHGKGEDAPILSIDHNDLENGMHNLHWTYRGTRILTGMTYDEAMYTLQSMVEIDNKDIVEKKMKKIKGKKSSRI